MPRPQRTCRRVGDVESGDWADGGESDEGTGRTVAGSEERFSCRVEESFGEISSIEVDDEKRFTVHLKHERVTSTHDDVRFTFSHKKHYSSRIVFLHLDFKHKELAYSKTL